MRLLTKALFIGLICVTFCVKAYGGDSIAQRIALLEPTPAKLLPRGLKGCEKLLMRGSGLLTHWQRYQGGILPKSSEYKGYIHYADPFHHGRGRINFWLGSDCSHFVHRLYQLMGANFVYSKTRHFLFVAMRSLGITPISNMDFFPGQMEELRDSFDVFELGDEITQLGDIIVWPTRRDGLFGAYGHMGVVLSGEKLLHNRYGQGVVVQNIEDLIDVPQEAFIFRWKGPLEPLRAESLKGLLELEWESYFSRRYLSEEASSAK